MNRYILYSALSLSLLSPCVFCQATFIGGNAQSPGIDRTEILGRLALAYSPSYVGYLVERLTSVDASSFARTIETRGSAASFLTVRAEKVRV
jgi:hypothetical protein